MIKNVPSLGTPVASAKPRSRNRCLTPRKQIIGRELAAWLGKLTLSGGDLNGQSFTVWPWEKRFIAGTFGQPGNAALSIGRGNGKSGFVAALAAAVVCPGALRCMASSAKSSVWQAHSCKAE